jgi:hypothetical protein
MCSFGDNCYNVAEYKGINKICCQNMEITQMVLGDPETSCKLGKPAAIESSLERQFLFFLLKDTCKLHQSKYSYKITLFVFQGIANVEFPIIATAGRVTAWTTELIWNNWNLPVSEKVIGDLEIKPKVFDQVLYLSQMGGKDVALISIQ